MVNVIDIKGDEIPTPTKENDMLDLLFARQHYLAEKYLPIEKENGLLQTEDIPVDINDRKAQARLKDFAWRVSEELYEATDALITHQDNINHFLEEMIDALHFFLELNILCGIDPQKIKEYFALPDDVDKLFSLHHLVMNLPFAQNNVDIQYIPDACLIYTTIGQPIGNAMNKLKNKPWKQSHMVTEYDQFIDCLIPAWVGFFRVLGLKHGLTAEQIFTLYFKKSEVNKFRIRSNY